MFFVLALFAEFILDFMITEYFETKRKSEATDDQEQMFSI